MSSEVVSYCEVADVREALRVRSDYTDSDDEMRRCIFSAGVMLRSWAKARSLVISADAVPEDVAAAAANLAAWMFKMHGDPPVDDKALYSLADEFFGSWAAGQSDSGYVGMA